ncbi:MAG TPA: Ig domain-containing protein, partial [Polyangia bacterium]
YVDNVFITHFSYATKSAGSATYTLPINGLAPFTSDGKIVVKFEEENPAQNCDASVSELWVDTNTSGTPPMGVVYEADVQNLQWMPWMRNGATSGTTGQSLRLEAFKVMLTNAPAGARIRYKAYVQNSGWQNWAYDGAVAGTTGQNLRVEAFAIVLEGLPANAHVKYNAYVENVGWQGWVSDGATAGTIGQSRRVEALQVVVYQEPPPCAGVCSNPVSLTWDGSYQGHPLGTAAVCRQTTQNIVGGNCGNLAGNRALYLNGTRMSCNGAGWTSIPAKVNGGYCLSVTPGDYSYGYVTLW